MVVVVVSRNQVVVVVVVRVDVELFPLEDDAREMARRRRRVASRDDGVDLDVTDLDVTGLDVTALGASVGFFFLRRTTRIYSFTKTMLKLSFKRK